MTPTILLTQIVSKLKTKFGYNVYTIDTEKGYEPNCFYVEIISDTLKDVAQAYTQETITFCITYFADTKKAFESELTVETNLLSIFNRVLDFTYDSKKYSYLLRDKEFTFTDNHTLQMTFSADLTEYAEFNIDTTNNNTMQNLYQNEEVK